MDDYEIECICDPSEGEPWEFYFDKWCTAKKKGHVCCECEQEIEIGKRYLLTRGKAEGEWMAYKRCEFCNSECERIQHEHQWPVMYTDLACCLVAEIRGEL